MTKLVNVRFQRQNDATEYTYRTSEELETDEMVVVETSRGLSLATVTTMVDTLPDHLKWDNLKEVVASVDLTAYNERKLRAEKRQILLAQMNQKVEELQNLAIFEALAEKDPAMRTMLDELKTLIN